MTLLAACTSSGPDPAQTTLAPSGSSASGSPGGTGIPPEPRLHEVRAHSCPFAVTTFVRSTMGMRLGRLTVLRTRGQTVGCRIYALQNSPLHVSEHLPGPHQPVVEIVTRHLSTARMARDAFILLSRKGKNAARVNFGRHVGVCFQTDFYPRDDGNDWACATSVGRTEVVVRTVDTTGTFSTAAVTKRVLRRV
jgi:hypothetical protein